MAITAIAPAAPITNELTYNAYMAEPETEGRYDIVQGVRIVVAGASRRHQRVAGNIERLLYAFEQQTKLGITVSAPFDVLIRRFPKLQTRQPDVLFVSHVRLMRSGSDFRREAA